jgi:hypothetical protein
MKILKEFLLEHKACDPGFKFAKDLTLEEFLNTCERGDWILWLFARINPNSLRELTLAKGHCANTVRNEMKDERSLKAVDIAIAFGEGKATKQELDAAADAADAAVDAVFAADAAVDAVFAAAAAAYAAYAAVAAADRAARAAADNKEENQKLTADICRKYLPLSIWNQENL